MDREPIIEVRNLTKRYGKTAAIDRFHFQIFKGEIFGLVGPNGAGKSTFISVLTSLVLPTEGEVIIKGLHATKQAAAIKKIIGFVPQDIALYPALSGMDNLKFWGSIYGLRGSILRERILEVLEVTGLGDKIKERVESYSGGMKRRLNIGVALLHHPEILIMDEPTAGVDIQSRKLIIGAVRKWKEEGRTVVYSSHFMDEMEQLCDRIALIKEGKTIDIGTIAELKGKYEEAGLEGILLNI